MRRLSHQMVSSALIDRNPTKNCLIVSKTVPVLKLQATSLKMIDRESTKNKVFDETIFSITLLMIVQTITLHIKNPGTSIGERGLTKEVGRKANENTVE